MNRIQSQQEGHENPGKELSCRSIGVAPDALNGTSGSEEQRRWSGWVGRPRFARSHGISGMLFACALLLAAGAARGQSVFATPQPVNTTSAAQNVTVTAQAAGNVATVEVLTLGVGSLEFGKGTGALTCESASLASGATCQESVAFTPAFPGLRLGAVVLLDINSNVLGTAYLSGTGLGGLGVFTPGNVTTIAGMYRNWTSTANGIPAIQANLEQPSSIVFDGAGNLYIADSGSTHNQIRMVCASATSATINGTSCPGAGTIVRIAGTGGAGYSGDGGPASAAVLNDPSGLALDGAGNLYIADTGNNAIRKISAATGIITTVAGSLNGTQGFAGDGGLATSAELNSPQGITIDSGGNLYIADTGNQRIRKVAVPASGAAAGIISTVAGNGRPSGNGDGKGTYSGDGQAATNAGLSLPYAVAFDASGDMFIPDSANHRIRMVAPSGIISTVAGTGNPGTSCANGMANQEALNTPSGVAVDAAGNLYIADTQDSCIRETNASTGIITAIAWNGGTEIDSSGSTSPIQVYAPIGLYLDGYGNLYFADFYDMMVEEIVRNQAILNFTATPVRQGSSSAPQNQSVENDGNSPLDVTAIVPDVNSAINDAFTTTPCTTGNPFLAVDADCAIGVEFAPSATLAFPPAVTSQQIIANVGVGKQGDTANSPLDIELIGVADAVNSTTVAVTSSINPSAFGQSVTFTATVTTGSGTGNLTGTVSFLDGTETLQANVALNAPPGTTSTATFTTGSLTVGQHSITATYNNSGDLNHFSSTSTALTQTVQEATATNLTSSANPSAVGQNVTFTATVTSPAGGGVTPDGTVGFYDGTTILQTVPVSGGVATYSTALLAQGPHAITAIYNGDTSKAIEPSTSNIVNQDVQASAGNTVTSSLNPSSFGSPVTFTATIAANGSTAATGTISFLDGGVQIGAGNLAGASNQATFTTSSLASGAHTITASYPGDTNYSASVSAALTQTVNKVTPTITWSAPAAILYGTALSAAELNASVNGVAGTFVYTPASGAVLATGTQTLSVTFTPTDSADYGTATATVQLTVNPASPTMMLSSSNTPSSFGSPVTFTATISNGPTGSVTFYDGGVSIGSGALQGGSAAFTTSALSVGAHTITATWAGSSNYNPATSNAITQTVSMGAPGISWATPAAISYGTALSATQLDATATIAGTFSYNPAAGTVLSAGSRTLSVTFSPTDTTDYKTATATVPLQVNQITPAISWTAPAAISYGTPLSTAQLNATSGSVPGTFYYTPPAGTVLAAGVQTLSATFLPSDTTDYSSPTATVSLTVNKTTPTIALATSGTPSSYGTQVTLTATLSSGPTGTVTFYDGGNAIGTAALQGTIATLTTGALAVGSHTITASWAGNNNYNPVTSSAIAQTVNPTQTATALTVSPNPGIAGLASVLTVTVNLTSGAATPTGTVNFTDTFNAKSAPLGSLVLSAGGGSGSSASGTATFSPMLAPGVHTLVATYSGDADNNGSASAPLALTVNLATTAATVTVAPNPALVLAPVTCAVTVNGNGGPPTGSVSIYANGTTKLGSGSLQANGTAAISCAPSAVGSYQITAVYAGDTNDLGATSPAVTEAVNAIPTAAALGSSTTGGASPQVILAATVVGVSGPTPTGTVTFSSGSTTLGSAAVDATGVATLSPNLATGVSYSIVAAYSGDALHGPSTSAALQISGTPTDFTVAVTPPTLSLSLSQNGTLNVAVTSYSGFADTIGLGCASLPAGVNCHFSSPNIGLAANAKQAVQLTIDTNNPLGGGATAMVEHPGSRRVSLAGVLLPLGLFFGCIFYRFRRRYSKALVSSWLLVLAAALLTGLTACSGITQTTASPGTYVIQVFGAGANSNVTHYQNVTLTITQ